LKRVDIFNVWEPLADPAFIAGVKQFRCHLHRVKRFQGDVA
jgi:hypothetical protein